MGVTWETTGKIEFGPGRGRGGEKSCDLIGGEIYEIHPFPSGRPSWSIDGVSTDERSPWGDEVGPRSVGKVNGKSCKSPNWTGLAKNKDTTLLISDIQITISGAQKSSLIPSAAA